LYPAKNRKGRLRSRGNKEGKEEIGRTPGEGIGEAIVRRFTLGGARVATTARSPLPQDQSPALFVQADNGLIHFRDSFLMLPGLLAISRHCLGTPRRSPQSWRTRHAPTSLQVGKRLPAGLHILFSGTRHLPPGLLTFDF